MTTTAIQSIDSTIRAAAAAKGYDGVQICRCDHRSLDTDQWEWWYWLAVQREAGSGFETLGRRRTKTELLELIEKPRYQRSTGGVG